MRKPLEIQGFQPFEPFRKPLLYPPELRGLLTTTLPPPPAPRNGTQRPPRRRPSSDDSRPRPHPRRQRPGRGLLGAAGRPAALVRRPVRRRRPPPPLPRRAPRGPL